MTKERVRVKTKYESVFGYKTADGTDITWHVKYYDQDGVRRTAKAGKKSRGCTPKKASVFKSDLESGKVKNRKQIREEKELTEARNIVHLYEQYVKNNNGKGKDDSIFNRWVEPYWAGKNIEKATDTDAANYCVWLKSQNSIKKTPLSPQTVKHAIGMFRRIVRSAKKHIKGFTLQIENFDVPKVKNETTEDLSEKQLSDLLAVLNADSIPVKRRDGKTYPLKVNRSVADMMLLALNTGMRRGEILKLQWKDVNFKRKTILLREPKGGEDVTIPMNSGAKAIFQRNRKNRIAGYVFSGKDGGQRLHVHKQATLIRDLAALPKDFRPFHGLRHYFGTELHAKGVNIKVISELMGHKDIGVTQRYLNARKEEMKSAVELISIGGAK